MPTDDRGVHTHDFRGIKLRCICGEIWTPAPAPPPAPTAYTGSDEAFRQYAEQNAGTVSQHAFQMYHAFRAGWKARGSREA